MQPERGHTALPATRNIRVGSRIIISINNTKSPVKTSMNRKECTRTNSEAGAWIGVCMCTFACFYFGFGACWLQTSRWRLVRKDKVETLATYEFLDEKLDGFCSKQRPFLTHSLKQAQGVMLHHRVRALVLLRATKVLLNKRRARPTLFSAVQDEVRILLGGAGSGAK